MSLRAHSLFQDGGTMEPGVERVYCVIETSTSGTILAAASTNVTRSKCAVTVAKTAAETGRYTFTFDGGFKRLLASGFSFKGTDDAAYTAGKGEPKFLRNLSASGGTVYLQCRAPASQADAEVEDGVVLYVWFDIQLSSLLDR